MSKLFFKIFLRFRCRGKENFPKTGGVIVASNHISFLDPVALGIAVTRPLNFLARSDLFEANRFFGWLLSSVNAFPIKRHGFDKKSLTWAVKQLKSGRALMIFPEGTRSKDGTLGKAHPGLGMLVCLAGVPVIPAFIFGAERALPVDSKFIHLHPVSVIFGKPIFFKDIARDKQGKSIYQDISNKVMEEISNLRYESNIK
ncbi:MAG: 1-acyl-sn-glycerol-3-phosphate acyltransferase [Candidatus Omnitrophica bacterium]|nr:1-acyl-sn-glycerol-3-phosphate acyltransferase [Candidatus Omnitrophota bacterium]